MLAWPRVTCYVVRVKGPLTGLRSGQPRCVTGLALMQRHARHGRACLLRPDGDREGAADNLS